MILYHGSTEIIKVPEIRKRDKYLDFGPGFYTTTSYEQAERWAKIKMRRNDIITGYVSVYEFDLDSALSMLTFKEFECADEEWLDFVVKNRNGELGNSSADLHIGPVANDNIYRAIRLFETGAYDAEYTVKKLKTEVLHDQWTLHTEKALTFLKFKESMEIKENK